MQKIFRKLKKLPPIAWVLILYIALFMRDLGANLTVNHSLFLEFIDQISSSAPEIGSILTAIKGVEWVSWLIQPLIGILFFEVVMSIIISFAMGRRALLFPKPFIMHEFRIFYVGATLVTAVLSAFVAVLPHEYVLGYMELIKIPIYIGCYILYYWLLGKDNIIWGQKATVWQMIATLLSAYFVGSGFLNFVSALTADKQITADIVMSSLVIVFALLAAGAMFLFRAKVKENEKQNPPPPPPVVEEEKKAEIFKGFGF